MTILDDAQPTIWRINQTNTPTVNAFINESANESGLALFHRLIYKPVFAFIVLSRFVCYLRPGLKEISDPEAGIYTKPKPVEGTTCSAGTSSRNTSIGVRRGSHRTPSTPRTAAEFLYPAPVLIRPPTP